MFEELAVQGFAVGPAELCENLTTRGTDLLGLPRGTSLRIGATTAVEKAGLRNPCQQIEDFKSGLLSKVLVKSESGALVRKTGVMGIVTRSGVVLPGDEIHVELPEGPPLVLEKI